MDVVWRMDRCGLENGWMWFGKWIVVVQRVEGWMDVVWRRMGGWIDVVLAMEGWMWFGEWMGGCGLENRWVDG